MVVVLTTLSSILTVCGDVCELEVICKCAPFYILYLWRGCNVFVLSPY